MSSFKGIVGETVINVAMWLKLEKDVYHRLNNITLPLADGGSTKLIMLSSLGMASLSSKLKTIKAGFLVMRSKDNGRKFSWVVSINFKIHCGKIICI